MKANQICNRSLAIIFLCYLSCMPLYTYAHIRLLFSAALTDAFFDFRKQQYIESFSTLKSFNYKNVYVVEALKKAGPTFLDDYSDNVFYSTANDPRFRNQGTNEARTCLQATYYFAFDPEDMIIKLTGRHCFTSDIFLRLVENNDEYDAFVKLDAQTDVSTVCFAMKCKYFREMYETIDFNNMERRWINLETEVGNYIKRKIKAGNFKVKYVEKLGVRANNYGSSTAPGALWNIIDF